MDFDEEKKNYIWVNKEIFSWPKLLPALLKSWQTKQKLLTSDVLSASTLATYTR
jgi:hypothetical protein